MQTVVLYHTARRQQHKASHQQITNADVLSIAGAYNSQLVPNSAEVRGEQGTLKGGRGEVGGDVTTGNDRSSPHPVAPFYSM